MNSVEIFVDVSVHKKYMFHKRYFIYYAMYFSFGVKIYDALREIFVLPH